MRHVAILSLAAVLAAGGTGCKHLGAIEAAGFESAGPRFGYVLLTGKGASDLKEKHNAGPLLSVWGWQLEYQYAASADGPIGLIEFIPLVVGLDENLPIPSINMLFGLRLNRTQAFEFMCGPNLAPNTEEELSVAMTVALGYTFRAKGINIPVNFAFVTGEDGMRYSLTMGWNMHM